MMAKVGELLKTTTELSATVVLIEDKASGTQLIQELIEDGAML